MSPQRLRRCLAAAILAWSARALAADPPPVVQVTTLADQPALLGALHRELSDSRRYRLLPLSALMPLLRQQDEQQKVLPRGRALIEQGRAAAVSLDNERARELLSQGLAVLERGFVRHYDPAELAQAYVQRGVAAVQGTRPDLARRDFVAALHHDPLLKLGPYYSPQVREAFAEARRSLPVRPPPSVEELGRLAAVARAKLAILVSGESTPESGHLMLKVALFESALGRYTDVESVLVEPSAGSSSRGHLLDLARKVRASLERRFPLTAVTTRIVPRKGPVAPPRLPPPPPKRWYKRWYTWVAAGAVVATTALVLPFALRQREVDLSVRWPVTR